MRPVTTTGGKQRTRALLLGIGFPIALLVMVCAIVMVTVFGLPESITVHRGSAPSPRPVQAPAVTTQPPAPLLPTGPTVPASPAEPAAIPPALESPAGTVQELVDARAAAWQQGEVALLSTAMAQGSPAEAYDREQLDAALQQGIHYPSVHFDVLSAEIEAVEEDGRVALEVTIAREALEAEGAEGTLESSAARTDHVRLVLTRQEEGWRLWEWR